MATPQGQGRSRRGAVLRDDDGRLERGRRTFGRLRGAVRELASEPEFDKVTLRQIAERAGIGASSIYRHVKSKGQLLILELIDLQQEAYTRFRREDDRSRPTRERLHRFFEVQHEMLVAYPKYSAMALRATTDVLDEEAVMDAVRQRDQSVALLVEILQSGRRHNDLTAGLDLLTAAETIYDASANTYIRWARGQISEAMCRRTIVARLDLLFRGIGASG